MNYEEARELFTKQWRCKELDGRKECIFPYNILYSDEKYIIASVSPVKCLLQETEKYIVDKYIHSINQGDDLGPSWGLYGKIFRNGHMAPPWHNKIYILDGNHRMAARIELKHKMVDVIMPQVSYDLYVRNYNE